MDRKKSFILGLFFVAACGLCVFYGYEKFKEYNQLPGLLNKTAKTLGIRSRADMEIPTETKYAGFAAALTGITAAYFLVSATGKKN